MIKKIVGIHYSPTGGVAKVTRILAREVADRLEKCSACDITAESMDLKAACELGVIDDETVVIIGMPVYVGKLPVPAIKALRRLEGSGAMTLALVAYSGKDYGNSLYELTHYAVERELSVVGAGAISMDFVSARGRSFGTSALIDMASLSEYAEAASNKIMRLGGCEIEGLRIKPAPLEVRGRLPVHRLSKYYPRAAAAAQLVLNRLPVRRKESEWFL